MAGALERLKILLAVSIGWRLKGKLPEAIRNFQATEADGVWHLHRGLRRITDPKQRAILFAHSLEEERHAEEFAALYKVYGERPMAPANYEREDLYPAAAPAWKTFAYVHVGEKDATERFRCLREALGGGELKESLARIVADEEGHVDLTHGLLLRLGATEREIRGEVRKVRLRRLWDRWLRAGQRLVNLLVVLFLSVAYYAIGPLLFRQARRKLSQPFVEYDNSRVKRL